jgi:Glycosyl hydrolase family 26
MLGAYLDLHGFDQDSSLALRRQQLGRDLRIIHWYYNWEDGLPASYPRVPENTVVMLSWGGTSYDRILNGSQDALITRTAQNLATYGRPVFLRWAWEMNGDWFPWGGPRNGNKPQDYVQAWRHVHDIFARQKTTNVAWVWGPNFQSIPILPWNDVPNYYPGDDYVDWVGVSGYSDAVKTPEFLFEAFYREFASHKPMMIAETGVKTKGGRQSADWIDLLAQWLRTHDAVGALVWFDTDKHERGTSAFIDFRIDRDPLMLDAYRRLAVDPHFSG